MRVKPSTKEFNERVRELEGDPEINAGLSERDPEHTTCYHCEGVGCAHCL